MSVYKCIGVYILAYQCIGYECIQVHRSIYISISVYRI